MYYDRISFQANNCFNNTWAFRCCAWEKSYYISIQLFQHYAFFTDYYFQNEKYNIDILLSQRHWITFQPKLVFRTIWMSLNVDIKNKVGDVALLKIVKMNVHGWFNYSASSTIKWKFRFVINAGTEIKIALFYWSQKHFTTVQYPVKGILEP